MHHEKTWALEKLVLNGALKPVNELISDQDVVACSSVKVESAI